MASFASTAARREEVGPTPGPWRLDDPIHGDVVDGEYHIIDGGSGIFAKGDGFSISEFMRIEDARLIAAAPDLLTACIEVSHIHKCPMGTVYALDRAMSTVRAALAKATGAGS